MMPRWAVIGVIACSGGSGPPPAARTCQEARICARDCLENQEACVRACGDVLQGEARTAFEQVLDCTLAACGGWRWDCVCTEQCFGDGACLAATDACAAGGVDLFCDNACH
jgi:hypothetical protein